MKISPDTKDVVLFVFGILGMAMFGLVMPLTGFGFNLTLWGAWAGIAATGYVSGVVRKNGQS